MKKERPLEPLDGEEELQIDEGEDGDREARFIKESNKCKLPKGTKKEEEAE